MHRRWQADLFGHAMPGRHQRGDRRAAAAASRHVARYIARTGAARKTVGANGKGTPQARGTGEREQERLARAANAQSKKCDAARLKQKEAEQAVNDASIKKYEHAQANAARAADAASLECKQ